MPEQNTNPIDDSVLEFLNSPEIAKRREDSLVILDMMKEITGLEPELWSHNMIGFGSYHYVYESGREGDSFIIGFSPRKQKMVLYNMILTDANIDLLERLGNFQTGSACLYINKLGDVDLRILKELIRRSFQKMVNKYR
jgi:hypothetical protein